MLSYELFSFSLKYPALIIHVGSSQGYVCACAVRLIKANEDIQFKHSFFPSLLAQYIQSCVSDRVEKDSVML